MLYLVLNGYQCITEFFIQILHIYASMTPLHGKKMFLGYGNRLQGSGKNQQAAKCCCVMTDSNILCANKL